MNTLKCTVKESIAEIRFNNPPVNALTIPMIDELLDALREAGRDSGVRAVVLASDVSRRFCAGLDLEVLARNDPSQLHQLLEKLYVELNSVQFNLGKPSIAAVDGAARGGGMTVAISCDVIVAGSAASFGYPEIDVGVIPAIHFTHLPRVIGRHRAFDYLFTGRSFGVREAFDLGLVSRVVDEGTALEEARKLAQVFASKPPEVLRLARAAFMNANDLDYRRGIAVAVENFCSVAAIEESREGVRAFVEKRAPAWRKG